MTDPDSTRSAPADAVVPAPHGMAINPDGLYLDDIEPGMTWRTGEFELTADDIAQFAAQWDPQPFHTDPARAESTFFAGLAGSGWHTAAITMRLMVTEGMPLATGTIGGAMEVSWPTPTRPGDRLHVEGVVDEVVPSRSRADRGSITVTYTTINADGQVRQRTHGRVLVFRRPV